MPAHLAFKRRISYKSARALVVELALYGNHDHPVVPPNEDGVRLAYSERGLDFDVVVETCRDHSIHVPVFENLAGSAFFVDDGLQVHRVNSGGNEDLGVSGPAVFAPVHYWSIFEEAIRARNQSVASDSLSAYQAAAGLGVASIEAYLAYRGEIWNKRNPSDQLIDSAKQSVSLDGKIKDWVPRMTGVQIDRSDKAWACFLELHQVRNDELMHAKASGYSLGLTELGKRVDGIKLGLGEILIRLHKAFSERIPSVIVRSRHAPDVEIVTGLL